MFGDVTLLMLNSHVSREIVFCSSYENGDRMISCETATDQAPEMTAKCAQIGKSQLKRIERMTISQDNKL